MNKLVVNAIDKDIREAKEIIRSTEERVDKLTQVREFYAGSSNGVHRAARTPNTSSARPVKKRKPMSKAARKLISIAMKKRHAEKRKAENNIKAAAAHKKAAKVKAATA